MKINISNLDKRVLFKKLYNHVVAHHQKHGTKENATENVRVFSTSITTLTNLLNDPATVEIDTQSFNDIYGAGVFEKHVEELRKEAAATSGKGDIKSDGESKVIQDTNSEAIEHVTDLKEALEGDIVQKQHDLKNFKRMYDNPGYLDTPIEMTTSTAREKLRNAIFEYPSLIAERSKLVDVLGKMLKMNPIKFSSDHQKVFKDFINATINSPIPARKNLAKDLNRFLTSVIALTGSDLDADGDIMSAAAGQGAGAAGAGSSFTAPKAR